MKLFSLLSTFALSVASVAPAFASNQSVVYCTYVGDSGMVTSGRVFNTVHQDNSYTMMWQDGFRRTIKNVSNQHAVDDLGHTWVYERNWNHPQGVKMRHLGKGSTVSCVNNPGGYGNTPNAN